MTVVAYRNGIMAADRQITFGDTAHMLFEHKVRAFVSDGCPCVIGTSGHIAPAVAFMDWICNGRKGGEFKINIEDEDFVAYEYCTYGAKPILRYWQNNRPFNEDPANYCAIGSGRELALGAMEAGATAIEAVRAANKHSLYCGGGIVFWCAGEMTVLEA